MTINNVAFNFIIIDNLNIFNQSVQKYEQAEG